MNIVQYDTAVNDYFKKIFTNTVFASPGEAFRRNAEANDIVRLPMVSVFRESLMLGELFNFAFFKKGEFINVTEESMDRLRGLPIILKYQVDIWAASAEVGLGLFSELIFEIQDSPKINVTIPKTIETHDCNFRVMDIIDNTDLSLEISKGRLYRYTIMIELQGFIFKLVNSVPLTIELE